MTLRGEGAPPCCAADRSGKTGGHRALSKLQPRYLPQSPIGQAISYALNPWPALERFPEHGEVEIDHNLVENSI